LPTTDVALSSNLVTFGSGVFIVRSSARKTLRLGIRWKVPQGQYDVRWTRHSTVWQSGTSDTTRFDSAQIATLRSIKYALPSTTGTLKLAVKIKATDQLNGVINQLSVLGQQKVAVYSEIGEDWLPPETNFNPAWVYYWLLNACPGVAQLVDASRIDLDSFREWAIQCDAKGFTCKGMIDRVTSAGDLYKLILSSGRASFAMKDGKYSVLIDKDDQTPVQHFSPSNSRGFGGSRVFIDLPHGLRVKFQNPALNWQEDEIIVLRDGYSYNGLDARGVASVDPEASKFETLTVPFVTEPEAAWRIGRYHLAQAIYRSNSYVFTANIEHLVCNRGDLVYMAHDVTDWGSGFGLISYVDRNGAGQVIKIYTAEPLLVEAGETYSIRVRNSSGVSSISAISGLVVDDEATEFTLVTPMPSSVDTGDMYLIGKTTSAIRELLVTKITPSRDFDAELMTVEYSASVASYDEDPPASFISAISGTIILEPPPPPEIYATFSDYTNTPGDLEDTLVVGISPGGPHYTSPWDFYNRVAYAIRNP
jgi:Putative phage tail protein